MIYFKCLTKHQVIRLLSESPDEILYDILPFGYGDVVYFKIILGRVTDITGIPKPGELNSMLSGKIHSGWLRDLKLRDLIKEATGEIQNNINYFRIFFNYNENELDRLTLDNWSQGIKFTLLDPILDVKCYLYQWK